MLKLHADSSEAPKQHDKGSTFTLFKPGNNIYVGGKEAVMRVNSIHLQDNTIQRSCWKSYEKILKSLGEMANRKSCQVCGRAMIRMSSVEAKDWCKQVRLATWSAGSFPDKFLAGAANLTYTEIQEAEFRSLRCRNQSSSHSER